MPNHRPQALRACSVGAIVASRTQRRRRMQSRPATLSAAAALPFGTTPIQRPRREGRRWTVKTCRTFVSTHGVRGTVSAASAGPDLLRIPVSPAEQSSCKLSDETTRIAAELFNAHGLVYFDRIMSLDWVRHRSSRVDSRQSCRFETACRGTRSSLRVVG